MACYTSHKFYETVAPANDVPLLHIPVADADRLVADRRTNDAVLGTRFTMTEDFIRGRIEARGITLVPIEETWIREVDRIIFDELAVGRVVRDSQRSLKTLITELAKRKTQAVLLACTELVFAVDVRANVIPVYDTTAIHARAAVDWMLADHEEARAAA
jgi:aspartate racemase